MRSQAFQRLQRTASDSTPHVVLQHNETAAAPYHDPLPPTVETGGRGEGEALGSSRSSATAAAGPGGSGGEGGSPGPDGDDHVRTVKIPDGEASVMGSVTNLVNNIIGAGLLALPWAMQQSSIIGGTLAILWVCFANAATVMLLAQCCELSGVFSFKAIGQQVLGQWFGVVAQVIIIGFTLGSCISYVVLIGDFIPRALQLWFPDTDVAVMRTVCILVVSAIILFPLAAAKDLNKLRFTSTFAVIVTVYCLGTIIVESAVMASGDRGSITVFQASYGVWGALPVINVAFAMHYNAPRYYQELQGRSIRKFLKVVLISFGFSCFVYLICAYSGYFMFGNATQGNILNNFGTSDFFVVLARFGMGINIIFTYPLPFHSLRTSILVVGTRCYGQNPTRLAFLGTVAVVVICTVLLGLYSSHVEVVLAYKGAVFGCWVVYLFPCMMYASLRGAQLRQSRHVELESMLEGGTLHEQVSGILPEPPAFASPNEHIHERVTTSEKLECYIAFFSKPSWEMLLVLVLAIYGAAMGVLGTLVTAKVL